MRYARGVRAFRSAERCGLVAQQFVDAGSADLDLALVVCELLELELEIESKRLAHSFSSAWTSRPRPHGARC
jgi:hypothetical protein